MSDFQRTVTFNAGSPTQTQGAAATFARRALIILGGAACLALTAVSISFNVWFAQRFGTTELEKIAWSVCAGAFDLLKAIMPIAFFALWERKARVQAMFCGGIWVLAFGLGLVSAIGYAASSRDKLATDASLTIAQRDATTADLSRLESQLNSLMPYRPLKAIQSELARAEASHIYDRTHGCSEATRSDSIEFCDRYWDLRNDIGRSQSAADLEDRIAQLRTALQDVPRDVGTSSDVQADMIAKLMDVGSQTVSFMLSVLMGLLVEIGSSFAPALIIAGARAMRDTYPEEEAPRSAEPVTAILEPRHGSFEDGFNRWAMDNIGEDVSGSLSSQQAYAHFATWARFNGPYETGSAIKFGKLFKDHALAMGATPGRSGAKGANYRGITLIGKPTLMALPSAAQ